MFSLMDIIIVLFLIMGVIVGFKRGVFKSAVMFIGTILVLVLAFYLKNPLSQLMYTFLPFFPLGGGLKVLNILLYEGIAFLIVYAILMSILHILIKVTGIFEKLLRFTIILGIPSKILGAIFGFFETYIILFVIIFIGFSFNFTAPLMNESKYAGKIMNNSPVISGMVEDYSKAFQEIYQLKDIKDNDKYNQEALRIMLKYEIIMPDSALKLVEQNKLDFKGANDIVKEYNK